jgi:hypothetical protein
MAEPIPAPEISQEELQARLANIPGAPPKEPLPPVEAPPSWSEIRETDDYKSLDYPSQVDLARKWGEQSKQYAATLSGYNEQQAAQIDDFVANEAVEVPANVKRAAAYAGFIKGGSQTLGAIAGGAGGALLGGPVGAIAGGVGGMIAAGEAAEAGMQKFLPVVSKARKYAPGYATAGEYAPSVAMGAAGARGLATAGKALARELGTKKAVEEIAKTAAVSGLVSGGVGTATRAVLGAEVTPRTVAEDVLFGALFAGLGSGARVQGYNREQALNLNERVKSGSASEAEYRDWKGILAEAERTQAREIESAKRTEVELGGRPVFQKTELTQRPQPETRPVPTAELPSPRPAGLQEISVVESPKTVIDSTRPSINDFYNKLEKHDWSYRFSESSYDYNIGSAQEEEIQQIIKQGGSKYKKLYEDYYKYAFGKSDIKPEIPKELLPTRAELVREGEIITPRRVLPTTERPALPERAEAEVPAPTTEPAAPVGQPIREILEIAPEGKRKYVSMHNFIQSVGRDELGDILVNSPFDGSVSDDGQSIISFADPRNQRGKTRISSKEFFDWLNSDKVYEGLKFEGLKDKENYVRYVEDLRAKSIKGGGYIPRPLRGRGGEAGFIILDPAEKARVIAQRWATSRGDLPKEAFDILEAKDQRIQAMQKQVDFTLRDLAKATVEANGKRVFTEPQKAIIDSYMRGQTDVLQELPEPLQAPVAQMRRQLDNLTERLVESNVFTGPKAEAVLARRGEYVTRSYEKYDNPKFGFDLLQKRAPERLESAIKFLQNEIIASEPGISMADARQRAIGKAKEISTPEEGFSFDSLVNAANLGKDLSITKKRKDIPEEIRFLLGEYEDPIINYARTAVKMINLLQSQRTLTDLRNWGFNNGLFFDKPTGNA